MASLSSPSDDHIYKLPKEFHLMLSKKLALEESQSTLPNVTYDMHDFETTIFVCLIGLILFFIFYQVLDRFHNWLRNETFEHDIESGGDIADPQSLTIVSNWSREATTDLHYNMWLLEILNGFMALVAERRGVSPEELENALPLVIYKSLGKTLVDECVICLEDFEDDELCRVFPVCKHVFHFNCIENWLRDHISCPICRNCLEDV